MFVVMDVGSETEIRIRDEAYPSYPKFRYAEVVLTDSAESLYLRFSETSDADALRDIERLAAAVEQLRASVAARVTAEAERIEVAS